MTIQLSTAVRNARLNAIEATIGTLAIMKIRTGAAPADCAAADSGTVLAVLSLPSNWMADATAASKAKGVGAWQDLSVNTSGTAGHFRIYASDGTTCHLQGTVSAAGGGGDLVLNTVIFVANQTFAVSSFLLTEGAADPIAPTYIVPPVLSYPDLLEGSTITCPTGSWANTPTLYTYQWYRDGVAIGGATANTRVIAAADLNTDIKCLVTASNAAGENSAFSDEVQPEDPLPAAPTYIVPPVLTYPDLLEGSTITCPTGSWANSPTLYTYQWYRDGVAIIGSTASTRVIASADLGHDIKCLVTASNAGGENSAFSDEVTPSGVGGGGTPPGTLTYVTPGDSLATIQGKLNSVTAGNSLVFPAGSSFSLGGTLIGKSGITVWAEGTVTLTNGAWDFSGCDGFTIRGVSCTQTTESGFVFDDVRINVHSATGDWVIANCTFQNHASAGGQGSAIFTDNAENGTVINCTFNDCGGNVVGIYHMDHMLFDGLHFNACYQPFAVQQNSDVTTKGRSIWFYRIVCLGTRRAAIEVGPSGHQFYDDLRVIDCFMDDFDLHPSEDIGEMLAISLVGQGAQNTTVQGNFARRGSRSSTSWSPWTTGYEFTGTGDCSDNISWGFRFSLVYQHGADIHDNTLYDTPTNWTGNYGATFTSTNNLIVTTPPAVPAQPARVAWP